MKKNSLRTCLSKTVMALAVAWALVASWLSANLVISVCVELSCYALAFYVLLGGACVYVFDPNQPRGGFSRHWVVAFVVLVFVSACLTSNITFFYWKLRAIPQDAWAQMVSDLQGMGRQMEKDGKIYLTREDALPSSIQRLGLRFDYKGGGRNEVRSPDYNGVEVSVYFGNKMRGWGLCVGSKGFVESCFRGGRHIRVAPNAYFFVGSWG
jgi:hypothetical protein